MSIIVVHYIILMQTHFSKHPLSYVAELMPNLAAKTSNAQASVEMLKTAKKLQALNKGLSTAINTREKTKAVLVDKVEKIANTKIVRLKSNSFFYNAKVAETLHNLETVAIQKCKLILQDLGLNGIQRGMDTTKMWRDAFKSAFGHQEFDPFNKKDEPIRFNFNNSRRSPLYAQCANPKVCSYRYMHAVFEHIVIRADNNQNNVLRILSPIFDDHLGAGIFKEINQHIDNVSGTLVHGFNQATYDQRMSLHRELSAQQTGLLRHLSELIGSTANFLNLPEYLSLHNPVKLHAHGSYLDGEPIDIINVYPFENNMNGTYHGRHNYGPDPNMVLYLRMLYNSLYETMYHLTCAIHMIRRRACDLLCNDDKSQIELLMTCDEVKDLGMLVARTYVLPFKSLRTTNEFRKMYSMCELITMMENMASSPGLSSRTRYHTKKQMPCIALDIVTHLKNIPGMIEHALTAPLRPSKK